MDNLLLETKQEIQRHLLEIHFRERTGNLGGVLREYAVNGSIGFNAEHAYFLGYDLTPVARRIEDLLTTYDGEDVDTSLDKGVTTIGPVPFGCHMAEQLVYMNMLGVAQEVEAEKLIDMLREHDSYPDHISRYRTQQISFEGGIFPPFYGLLRMLEPELREISPQGTYTFSNRRIDEHFLERAEDALHLPAGVSIHEGDYLIPLDDIPLLKTRFKAVREPLVDFVNRIKNPRDDPTGYHSGSNILVCNEVDLGLYLSGEFTRGYTPEPVRPIRDAFTSSE